MIELNSAPQPILMPKKSNWLSRQEGKVGYVLAWLLGVPLPILVIIYLFRGH